MWLECVPNFSDGRSEEVRAALLDAARQPGVWVLGTESDPDHHRSVFTLAGHAPAMEAAAIRLVETAAQHIDLTRHRGVHPRIGAADVVPFIPLQGASMEDAVRVAHAVGEAIWARAHVPVYFYEFAALRPDRRRLEQVRRGGFDTLRQAVLTDPARRPDVGGPSLHPTAGATAVGARHFLVACNINLDTTNLSLAQHIARTIRTSSGGLPHVKALGLPLATQGLVQVSMNLTHFEETPLGLVYERVRELASAAHVAIAETELIGFLPQAAAAGAGDFLSRCRGFSPSRILEVRLAEISEASSPAAESLK
jgi:glutamate formiminotransferase